MTTPISAQQLEEVLAFLDGTGELRGVSFGEIPDGERGKYWWRKHLQELAPTLRRALAALEAVEGAERFSVSEDACGSIVSQLTAMGYYHGQRVLIIPADAVEVSRG